MGRGGGGGELSSNPEPDAVVVTFSWNTCLKITIHLHECSPISLSNVETNRSWCRQSLLSTLGRRHNYPFVPTKCDDNCGYTKKVVVICSWQLSFKPFSNYEYVAICTAFAGHNNLLLATTCRPVSLKFPFCFLACPPIPTPSVSCPQSTSLHFFEYVAIFTLLAGHNNLLLPTTHSPVSLQLPFCFLACAPHPSPTQPVSCSQSTPLQFFEYVAIFTLFTSHNNLLPATTDSL